MRTLSLLPRHVASSSVTDGQHIAIAAGVISTPNGDRLKVVSAPTRRFWTSFREKHTYLDIRQDSAAGYRPGLGFLSSSTSNSCIDFRPRLKTLLHTRDFWTYSFVFTPLSHLYSSRLAAPPWPTPSIRKSSTPAFATSHPIFPTTRKLTCFFMQCGVCKLRGA